MLSTTLLTGAIRRDILALLAESDTTSVQVATAQIAAGWGARCRRRGDSPSSAHTAEAIAFQVGADLADDVAPADRIGRAEPEQAGRPVRARVIAAREQHDRVGVRLAAAVPARSRGVRRSA